MSKYRHPVFLLPADRPKLSRLIAFVLGAATTLAFAPFGLSLLAPLLILPLLLVSLSASPRDAAAHAFWYGFGLFLTGTYWIYISVHVFGNAALWIALLLMVGLALIMAAFVSLAGWLMSRLAGGEAWYLLPVAPAAWVLVEWLRGWVLTGFPWMAFGYGQIDTAYAGWAPVLGVYGVSFMVVFSMSALIATAMASSPRGRILGAACVVLPWLVGVLLTFVAWTEPTGSPLRVSILQAGVSQDQKWDREHLLPIMQYYQGMTLSVPDSDIVLWPEVAIPALDDQVEPFLARVESDARRNGQTVLLGILERSVGRDVDGRIFNSVLLLGTAQRQRYRKRHLVPFGEYFPVPPSVRNWMKMQNLPHSDLAKGDDLQPLLVAANGTRFGVAICYEDAYGAEQLYALPEAGMLINVSNDGWFGDSIAPHQHLEIARMRSLEFGRPAVRSTNTGISAFIGADGALLEVGKQHEAELMTRNIRAWRGATPYVTLGNWPIIWLCIVTLAAFWIRNRAHL
ncbi:MAG: apolipoprotein N-acyltransferase [Gammaproteobacteria bacterium]|nr:apolipoprotein N-acyltransferase [Gammaproteobacteria bacterium]NNL62250.1 apolipoprotein N-acyltransferase [Woeseiaceae bacterium]